MKEDNQIFYKENRIAAMPEENRLLMPVQSLKEWTETDERTFSGPDKNGLITLKRCFVFGATCLLTLYGSYEMYQVVSVSHTTILQWILLFLFIVNFYWISFSFFSSVLGFFALLRRSRHQTAFPEKLSSKTAVIMPVYNEGTERVFATISAMYDAVEQKGFSDYFDYFLLSDSTNPDSWLAEQKAFLDIKQEKGVNAPVYYRHRSQNTNKKSGNIEDFVTRWGGSYDHMLILDADSIMSADCMIQLASAMEDDPDSGIIQSLPLIINRNTFFARLQQFSAYVYGNIIATGVSEWSGRDGNYWGHNAIIRVKAFAAHCGLPDLSGKPPLGGHILSHDFIEAALMRRAGWSVYSLTSLKGSYEESPPSLIDLSIRDRRWCQGNMQHIRILPAKGFKGMSRQHLLTGIFSYLAAPFWLGQLLIGILLVWQSTYIRPEYFSASSGFFPVWPRFDAERALNLFILTMGILFAPKILGILLTLFSAKERKRCGGGILLLLSSCIEIIISALIAPVLTIIQSSSVIQIFTGKDSGWNPQRRDNGVIPWKDVFRIHRWHTLLGLITGLSAFLISTSLFLWMSPTIAGLLLAIPLSWLSGQLFLGLALKRMGLLLTPEEKEQPEIVKIITEYEKLNSQKGYNELDALVALKEDALLLDFHRKNLPETEKKERGKINLDAVIAEAKIHDANSIHEVSLWLSTKEKKAVIENSDILQKLLALPLTYNP